MSELTQPVSPSVPLGAVATARSIVIALAILGSVLHALPGDALKREALIKFERTLTKYGAGSLNEPIAETLVATSKTLVEMRRVALEPVLFVFDHLGMAQRWNLFTMRGNHGFQIQVEGLLQDQSWRVVYRAHETDLLNLSPQLSYRRLRGIYNPRNKDGAKAQYDGFVKWVADGILETHPEYLGVRVSMQRLRLGTRDAVSQVISVDHVAEIYRPGTP